MAERISVIVAILAVLWAIFIWFNPGPIDPPVSDSRRSSEFYSMKVMLEVGEIHYDAELGLQIELLNFDSDFPRFETPSAEVFVVFLSGDGANYDSAANTSEFGDARGTKFTFQDNDDVPVVFVRDGRQFFMHMDFSTYQSIALKSESLPDRNGPSVVIEEKY